MDEAGIPQGVSASLHFQAERPSRSRIKSWSPATARWARVSVSLTLKVESRSNFSGVARMR